MHVPPTAAAAACRCLLYLTDDDLVALLRRCAAALRPGGLIVVKENICAHGFVVDGDDNSLTRSHAYWMVCPRVGPCSLLTNPIPHTANWDLSYIWPLRGDNLDTHNSMDDQGGPG